MLKVFFLVRINYPLEKGENIYSFTYYLFVLVLTIFSVAFFNLLFVLKTLFILKVIT